MKNLFLFIVVLTVASCTEVEFDEQVAPCFSPNRDSIINVTKIIESDGWQIMSVYFLEKDSHKIVAKIRKEYDDERWYYYEHGDDGEYKVKGDFADPHLLVGTYESMEITSTFTFGGDTIRLHRSGDYPKENPKYSLIVVTKKEGDIQY